MIKSKDTTLTLSPDAMPSSECLNILENLPQSFSEKLGLSYHVNAAKYFVANTNFKSKDVLEIGGSLPKQLVLEKLKVKQWISVNLYSWNDGKTPEDCISTEEVTSELLDSLAYQRIDGSADSLPQCFEGRFDVACSINAFEHIHNIWKALDAVYEALRPGGIFIATFGPIWPGKMGHHAWVDQNLNFNTFTIPPYTHLRYSKLECRNILIEQYGVSVADKFMQEAFFGPVINRLFVEDYIDALESSSFKYWKVDPWGVEKNRAVLDELESTIGSHLIAEGLNLIAQR